METLDDRRMVRAAECFADSIGIPWLTEIILQYARYSETELVLAVLNPDGNALTSFRFYLYPDVDGNINNAKNDKNVSYVDIVPYNVVGYRHLFAVIYYDAPIKSSWRICDIRFDDLLPSHGLIIDGITDYTKRALNNFRNKYLSRMRKLMSLI